MGVSTMSMGTKAADKNKQIQAPNKQTNKQNQINKQTNSNKQTNKTNENHLNGGQHNEHENQSSRWD